MNRKDDPPGVKFDCERKEVCSVHKTFTETLQKLETTVKGNGTLESQKSSLMGVTARIETTLITNGRWLKGLAGLVVAIFLTMIIPVMSWTQTSGKIIRQIEIDTQRLDADEQRFRDHELKDDKRMQAR